MSVNIKNLTKQGFSLIQVSMIVAVAGILLASVIPGGDLGSTIAKDQITRDRMEKIEEAAKNFMAANLRRPCPADGTLAIGNANFGVEDTTSGRCSNANFPTQSSPLTKTGTTTTTSAVLTALSDTTGLSIGMLVTNANLANDTHIASVDSASQITLDKYPTGAAVGTTLTFTTVVAGVVPTKTLGLPDEYMFDGYGRRIGYIVDIRATDRTTCRDLQVTKTSGNIQIMDSAASTAATDNVMWSLISYGKNGHGAFPMPGSSIANRINSGATNDDEEINAFINTAGTFATAFTQKLVKHEPVATAGATYFDDFVWTQEETKNTCCTGKMCNLGTRIGGTVAEPLGSQVKTGDINGDGITDLVIYNSTTTKIQVIFGRKTGWTPSGVLSVGTANSSRFITITDDSSGMTFLASNNFGNMRGNALAVGDLNGDGYDDIAMGYGNSSNAFIKVYYGSANPVSIATSAITDVITFPKTSDNDGPSIAIGHFANTAHKDILAHVRFASGTGLSTAYVIYGAASYSLTAEAVTTVASTVGFKINTTTPTLLRVMMKNTGDVNGDGYDEIIFGDYITGEDMHLLFGQSPANWNTDKTTAATGSTPDIVNIDARVAAGATEAIKFTNGGSYFTRQTLRIADMNNDGYDDIIADNNTYQNVYFGKAAGAWATPVDVSNASNFNGTNGIRFNFNTTKPTWAGAAERTNRYARIGDVNTDGKTDIVVTDFAADNGGLTNSGSNFIVLQPAAGWSSIWSSGTINIFEDAFATGESGLPLNNDTTKGFRIDGAYASDEADVQEFVDIDADGKNDMIVSRTDTTSSPEDGNIYIYFGKTLVPWDASNNISQLNRF
ncbi:MAG: FG-GAP repeat protein [Pseudomonadota bacterium]